MVTENAGHIVPTLIARVDMAPSCLGVEKNLKHYRSGVLWLGVLHMNHEDIVTLSHALEWCVFWIAMGMASRGARK